MDQLEQTINDAWEKRTEIGASTKGEVREYVSNNEAYADLAAGRAAVADAVDPGPDQRRERDQ